jgi:hypothetical protein
MTIKSAVGRSLEAYWSGLCNFSCRFEHCLRKFQGQIPDQIFVV